MSFELLSDPVHVHRQLSLFQAHYDTRCFLPIHVYHDVDCRKPVTVLLGPGKTPWGAQIRTLLKHLVRRIRRHWPAYKDLTWCEANGVAYISGLSGNRALHALANEVANDVSGTLATNNESFDS